MQENREAFYTFFNALKSASRFTFKELRSLIATNARREYTWEDGILLQTIVSNITLGRQMEPGLGDAIVAERRRDRLHDFMYRLAIVDSSEGEAEVAIGVLNKSGEIGSFTMILNTPSPTHDWGVKRLCRDSIRVHSIEDTIFAPDDLQELKDLHANGERFRSYTIFDNVKEPVLFRKIGTKFLQDLVCQINEYAGSETMELYQKFYSYADVMLTMHDDYICNIDYYQDGENRIMLEIEVVEPRVNRTNLRVASFKRILKKVGS